MILEEHHTLATDGPELQMYPLLVSDIQNLLFWSHYPMVQVMNVAPASCDFQMDPHWALPSTWPLISVNVPTGTPFSSSYLHCTSSPTLQGFKYPWSPTKYPMLNADPSATEVSWTNFLALLSVNPSHPLWYWWNALDFFNGDKLFLWFFLIFCYYFCDFS